MHDWYRTSNGIGIPAGASRALSHYVAKAVNRLDPLRYRQEAAYVAALFARLDGVVYSKPSFSIEIRSTVVADRGRGSAESKWGADFGIVARIVADGAVTNKGVLGQAKRGSLLGLSSNEAEQFRQQAIKMTGATDAILGLEVPNERFQGPTVRLLEVPTMYRDLPIRRTFRRLNFTIMAPSAEQPRVYLSEAIPLAKYLYAELLRCLHGDTDELLIRGLEDSDLSYLLVEARAGN